MIERGGRRQGDGEMALLFKKSSVVTHEESNTNVFYIARCLFFVFLRCDLGCGRGWVGASCRLSEALVSSVKC